MTITFLKSKSDIPLIHFRIPGHSKQYTALVDSGSEITLINNRFIEESGLEPEANGMMNVQGIDGKTNIKTGRYHFHIAFNKYSKKEKFFEAYAISTDLSGLAAQFNHQYDEGLVFDMIIGSDFLSVNKADIDYNNKVITINNK